MRVQMGRPQIGSQRVRISSGNHQILLSPREMLWVPFIAGLLKLIMARV